MKHQSRRGFTALGLAPLIGAPRVNGHKWRSKVMQEDRNTTHSRVPLVSGLVLAGTLSCALLVWATPVVAVPKQAGRGEQKRAPVNGSPGDWLLWGGPHRDFIASSAPLASTWPAAGPRKVWSRALGDGYSSIAVEGTTLYTTYRRGADDVITALDARTGATIWEFGYGA